MSSKIDVASLFCPRVCSEVSARPMQLPSLDNEAMLPSNEASKVGPKAPSNEEAKMMNVDTSTMEEKDNGKDKIPKTQDDSLSFPNLNTIEAKVDEL